MSLKYHNDKNCVRKECLKFLEKELDDYSTQELKEFIDLRCIACTDNENRTSITESIVSSDVVIDDQMSYEVDLRELVRKCSFTRLRGVVCEVLAKFIGSTARPNKQKRLLNTVVSAKILPDVILREVLKSSTFREILQQCSVSKACNAICHDVGFWKEYFTLLSGEEFSRVLEYVIRKGKMRFVKLIMGINYIGGHGVLKKSAAQKALLDPSSIHKDLQRYFIELPADQFVNKPEALQRVLTHSQGLFPEDLYDYILGLPADQFVNKPELLQSILEYWLFVLPEGSQRNVIGLQADEFENKPLALDSLVKSGLSFLSADLQRHIIGLPVEQFLNKPRALQYALVHCLETKSEDLCRYLIKLRAEQFFSKHLALQRLLSWQLDRNFLNVSDSLRLYIIGLPAGWFISKQIALSFYMKQTEIRRLRTVTENIPARRR